MENTIKLVDRLLKHRFEQADIRQVLDTLSTGERDEFLATVAAMFGRVSELLEVSRQLSETLSLDILMQRTLAITTEAINAERGTVFVNDIRTDELFSLTQQEGMAREIRIPNDVGIAGTVFQSGEEVVIDDAYSDSRFNRQVDRETGFTTRNILCAPLRTWDNKIIGVIQLLNKRSGRFCADDLMILETISHQAAAALQNGQLYQQMERVRAEETKFLEITSAISTELQLKPLLRKIMETTTSILDADRSTLFLYDDKRDELWSQVAQGLDTREIRFPADAGIAGTVFRSRTTINISDAHRDPRFNPEVDKKTGYFTKSILCVPVMNKRNMIIGVVQVLNKRTGAFTTGDERRLRAFSAQTSVAIENAKLFDEVMNIKNYNESILQSQTNGVITLDADKLVEKCNNAALRILGLESTRSIVGSPVNDYFSGPNAWLAEGLGRVLVSQETEHHVDCEIAIANGEKVSVNVTIVPLINIQKDLIGSMMIVEDISREKRLKGTLARYMDKSVADQLMSMDTELGGKMQEVTILFSDIRDFSGLSESMDATDTVSLLNEYFSTMVDVIFNNGGLLDKYIGDALLAVFGAPFTKEDDADRSIHAAVEMMRALQEFNRHRNHRNKKIVDIGIGINTGRVLIGNIGSIKRMDYTCIGDDVNLASRLEGANKYFGTNILASDNTIRELQGDFLIREVDQVRVKGATKSVMIYEVLNHHDDESFPHLSRALAMYRDGFARYRERQWKDGIEAFEAVLNLHGGDGLSRVYRDRCQRFLCQPPADDWDGIWDMDTK